MYRRDLGNFVIFEHRQFIEGSFNSANLAFGAMFSMGCKVKLPAQLSARGIKVWGLCQI